MRSLCEWLGVCVCVCLYGNINQRKSIFIIYIGILNRFGKRIRINKWLYAN